MRIINSLKNIFIGFLGQILIVALGFVSRRIFIQYLSIEYMGLNGLFSTLLQIILLVELGFSAVAQFSLYEPMAKKNYDKVTRLMNYFSKMYFIIFSLVLLIGILSIPFLNFFIKGLPDLPNLQLIYFLYLFNSAIFYLYAHKKFLLFADQKNYVYLTINSILKIFLFFLQMIAIIVFKSYLLYSLSLVITTLIEFYCVNKYVKNNYTFLNNHNVKISMSEKIFIKNKTKAMIIHKLGSIAVFSTDNLIISLTLGLKSIGLYSNYTMITTYLNQFIDIIFQGIRSSIGNYSATETRENQYKLFKASFFLNYLIYSYATIMFIVCVPSFISLWIGSQYSFSTSLVVCIAISFFLSGMRNATTIFNDVSGNFEIGRWMSIPESIINLIASIFLVRYIGITGVVLGTIISTILCPYVIEPYKLYKVVFQKKQLEYYKIFIRYIITTLIIGSIIYYVCVNLYVVNDFITFIIIGVIGTCIFCIINYFLYKRTFEFVYIQEKLLTFIRNRRW